VGVVYEDTIDERNLWERVTKEPSLAKPYLEKSGKPSGEKAEPSPKPKVDAGAKKPTSQPLDTGRKSPLFVPRKHFWEK
jgi:hypothetical protein